MARAAVLHKLTSQERKAVIVGADPACVALYDSVGVFEYITWYLSPEGLILQPALPHAMATCENDFLLPYAKLKPYLTVNGPLK